VCLSFPTVGAADGNLVINGGFELGDFTGWTVSGSVSVSDNYPNTGDFAADFSGTGVTEVGTISQAITTIMGEPYVFDFWVSNVGIINQADLFQASFGGNMVLNLVNTNPFPYTDHMYTLTATGPSTTIQFSGFDPDIYALDDVSVTRVSVPEPSTLLLFGAGLAGVGLLRRRFRK
jgi:hypothetical protein